MRWLTLYLRSRQAPLALILAAGCVALLWALWSAFSDDRDVDVPMVILTVLLTVATLTATLGGPDDALERTGSLPWLPRRAAHVLVAFAVVVLLVLVTQATGARFGPAWLVVRDAAGLSGLTALGAATVGVARSWFPPIAWTLASITVALPDKTWADVATWQVQPPGNRPAAITAGVLAAGGLLVYAVLGPTRRAPAEAAQ
ncbi:hypothetical protein AB0H83_33125 [Dactylosporangium sp. NPDC050688]|uniref:hypothetical protein n=1 Tax=Dactylosporangium sp. NPDC050688 TaxID=3157217 RepID=UPI00340C2D13